MTEAGIKHWLPDQVSNKNVNSQVYIIFCVPLRLMHSRVCRDFKVYSSAYGQVKHEWCKYFCILYQVSEGSTDDKNDVVETQVDEEYCGLE